MTDQSAAEDVADEDALRAAGVPFPGRGGVRVHPDPVALSHGPFPVGTGPNRFDDPDGVYTLRYLADTLRGCMVELLARFRTHASTEDALADVDGLDDPTLTNFPDPTPQDGLAAWLARQQIACVVLVRPAALFFVDVYNSRLLVALDGHPRVRAALQRTELRAAVAPDGLGADNRVHLDQGVVRLAGAVTGRPVTQAISRALYETRRVHGLAYKSRVDDAERCWALYPHVEIDHANVTRLDPAEPTHTAAVREAATFLRIALPGHWAAASDAA